MSVWRKIVGVLQTLSFKAFSNSSPTNGEMWFNGTDILERSGGVTRKSTEAITVTHYVNDTAHGFSVGDVVRVSGTNTYSKAQANSASATKAVGIVVEVIDADNFVYCSAGEITVGVPSGAANTVYYLSPSSAGAISSTEPSTLGNYIMPLLTVVEPSVKAIVRICEPRLIELKVLKGSATLNFASTAAQSASDLTITVTGATTNDKVVLGLPLSPSNGCYTAWVSSANTVKVRFNNYTSAAVDPASATFEVIVFQTA